eukprot:9633754-Alexandrium_andersonii.AAC.1
MLGGKGQQAEAPGEDFTDHSCSALLRTDAGAVIGEFVMASLMPTVAPVGLVSGKFSAKQRDRSTCARHTELRTAGDAHEADLNAGCKVASTEHSNSTAVIQIRRPSCMPGSN